MRVIKFLLVLLAIGFAGGCTITEVRPPQYVFIPRQFEAIQEGNAGKRVWVYSRGARDLSGPLRQIEATVGELINTACGLTMVKRERGDVPAHRFRLQVDQSQTSRTEDLGWDRRVRYQLYRVEAEMFLATNDELIASGVGKGAFSGEFQARRFTALRGSIRGVEVFSESPDALEAALRQAFTGLCYRIRQGPTSDPPRPGPSSYPQPETKSEYVPDARWLTACEPPSCYERRVSGGGLGVHVGGRVVGTRGVRLVRSGHTVRNGKIVPIH